MSLDTDRDLLGDLLAGGGLRSVYQPIVDLDSGATCAVEALVRGPAGSSLERPDLLFAEARRTGRLAELDIACRVAAIQGALNAGLTRDIPLFINIEPEVAHVAPTEELWRLMGAAAERLDLVIEVTERALVHSPASLLTVLARCRELGWRIALDDVGAEIESLALMPLVRPDVIKLDLALVQRQPDHEIASIVAAVTAQAERTGAAVLAEGIEEPRHRDIAHAMGATLGQGWMFGRPGPLGDAIPTPPVRIPRVSQPVAPPRSTVEAAAAGRPLRRSTKPLLLQMSWMLEREVAALGAPAVVLAAFQTDDRFTPATQRRYAAMARTAAFVGVLGSGLGETPVSGVRGGTIVDGDPLLDEWAIAIVGPHFAAALAATDLHDEGPDDERRFDALVTYDRDKVLAVAATLMARISAQTAAR